MIVFHITIQQPYRVQLPQGHEGEAIIELAESFLAQEASLPLSEQSLITPFIEALMEQAEGALDRADEAENERHKSSELLKKVDERAEQLIPAAQNALAATFHSNPAAAVDWGFSVRQTGRRRGHLRRPRTRRQILRLLNRYVPMEESRPAAERIATPSLAEMRQLRDDMSSLWRQRDGNQRVRMQMNADSRELCHELLDLLRHALNHLILITHKRQVTLALSDWGFTLVPTNGASGSAEEAATEASSELAQETEAMMQHEFGDGEAEEADEGEETAV